MMKHNTLRDFEAAWAEPGGSALDNWYERVRSLPIDHLSTADTCRSLRQGFLVDPVIRRAIDLFVADPAAGEIDEGELARALLTVPMGWWTDHLLEARRVTEVAQDWLTDQGGLPEIERLLAHLPIAALNKGG